MKDWKPQNFLRPVFWGVQDVRIFSKLLKKCFTQILTKGIFASDNLITFCRHIGFLQDQKFMEAYNNNVETLIEEGTIWRTHILTWAAKSCLRLEGDYVECGCYKGTSVKIICEYLDFQKFPERTYYLYDLFVHEVDMKHHDMPEHGEELYGKVQERFQQYSNIKIIKGEIPYSFEQGLPKKIAFMHIDMNSADAELAALEVLWERMVPGAILILDDYGWVGYYAQQKLREDIFFEERGYQVVELPTGQGMVIK